MRQILIVSPLLFTTFLHAQQSLHQARVEENLLVMKIVGVVVLLLIVMPFVLKKIRAMAPQPRHKKVLFVEEEESPKKKRKKAEEEAEPEAVDPLETALTILLSEHSISEDRFDDVMPLYRRYLELKMGRIEIRTGSFDFNTVLDSVMSRVHRLYEKRNFEIVFDIEADVPSKIIGDAERMEDVLFFLIQNAVLKSSTYLIELHIKKVNMRDNALHLEFYIPYDIDSYREEKEDIFTPFVGGETESNLELYIAKEYAKLMHGDVTFVSHGENDSAFVINMKLYMPNPSEMRHYRLPSKTMIGHSVLIVDDHSESAMAVKKMFEYFKNEVELLSSKEMFLALEMLEDYNIIVIQERFFARNLIAKVNEIKERKVIKVVSLNRNDAFEHTDADTIALLDGELTKPVTVQKVFDLLVELYSDKSDK